MTCNVLGPCNVFDPCRLICVELGADAHYRIVY